MSKMGAYDYSIKHLIQHMSESVVDYIIVNEENKIVCVGEYLE